MTLDQLTALPHVTGIKQVTKAVSKGNAQAVFLADNADSRVTDPLRALCREKGVEVVDTATMAELGDACAIEVGAAAAAVLR